MRKKHVAMLRETHKAQLEVAALKQERLRMQCYQMAEDIKLLREALKKEREEKSNATA